VRTPEVTQHVVPVAGSDLLGLTHSLTAKQAHALHNASAAGGSATVTLAATNRQPASSHIAPL